LGASGVLGCRRRPVDAADLAVDEVEGVGAAVGEVRGGVVEDDVEEFAAGSGADGVAGGCAVVACPHQIAFVGEVLGGELGRDAFETE
jgi:hypothetical protein